MTLALRLTGAFLGTALLLAAVVGSGIMSEIRPADAPGFMAAQLAGAFAATFLFRWLVPSLLKQARDVVAPHAEKELSHGR
jgi:glycerol uptake facilitator-like aquaporin